MKVLWISSHGGNYKSTQVKGTGGWVGALQTYLTERYPNLELGICFAHKEDSVAVKENNVTYFPIAVKKGTSVVGKLLHRFFGNDEKLRLKMIDNMMKVIESYKPDIIHIWGIENDYADIIPLISNLSYIVHIQGFTSACLTHYLPPAFSLADIYKARSLRTYIKFGGEKSRYEVFKKRAARELKVAHYVNNWFGRTDWDKSMSKIFNDNSTYFHCDEMMRSSFNESQKWTYHFDGEIIHIQSNISEDWYKGMDVVLKTAKILNDNGFIVNWKIFGWNRDSVILKAIIRKLGIIPEIYGIKCCGRVDAETIKDELLQCDVYVHPSYIENSSNAIAEAQLSGVPVVAQYVGGNPTMLKHDSGLLVQPNDPYMMANAIVSMCKKEITEQYSHNALNVASQRNNADIIIKDLMSAYHSIINKAPK